MNRSTSTPVAFLFATLMSSSTVFAQNAGRGAGAPARSPLGSATRLQQPSRWATQEQARVHERRLERLYSRDLKREQDRDRIYGANLMSSAERTQYEEHLRSLATEQERVQYRMEHQHLMQQRAAARHEHLGAAPSEAQIRAQERVRQQEREQIYGYSRMTPQEVAHYQAQLGAARTAQEREHIRAEHRQQMEARTRARGDSPPQ